MLKIGWKASAEQFGPRELLEYAVQAEQCGLDSVFISDHFQPWRHQAGHAPFAMSWLAAAGERTARVQLGTSVMTPTFRYNPAVVAQAFGTLGALHPGRIVLGIGTGEALNEVAVGAAGSPWPEFKERFARLRESVTLMRRLWTEERVTFEGTYFRTHDATVYDRPDEPIPVYVAAGGPLVARYAGRSGDGFICTSGKGRALYEDKLLPAVDEGLEKSGRTREQLDRMIEIKLSYDRDPDTALTNCRFWAPLSLTAEQKHGVDDPVEMERLADELSDEQVAKRWIVTSDPEHAAAEIKQYVDWGFNHLVVHAPGADQGRFLEQFRQDVLPRLRALG
ncbi:MAG TPA: glucose-6-phosphate dehydrogenase (coenzyme-F420) [Intrasporangium sp.]|uniref:glucose-6-phosphate dehydrogenase (coenzyme-F420) n=1 Tax=Intrasporangium sp. TaxID=1925024 RepID=UPI002D78402E|nr:glucose-6-phosphate dehydrogenase (coenzyme-F420) [Intrasporangium sp.]HET7399229.1 glucose-6-phosphate dehydrogenase (coenzyme-F420) [Intrasporangium sp.]